MMLNLTEVLLDDKRIETEVESTLDRLDYSFGSYPVEDQPAVFLTVEKEDGERLRIHGETVLKVRIPCDRCLESVTVPLELDFTETVFAGGAESPDKARRGPEDEDGDDMPQSAFEPDYYLEGYNLDVDKLLFGEALLNWPSRVLCKEDCKGLCPVCGQNLNHGDCGCERKALDPRMAKVLDVFSKFKEV